MDRNYEEKAYIAAHLLRVYPKSIRAEILKDTDFCKDIALVSDATITFGGSAASFSRAVIMASVRQAYASKTGSAIVKCEQDNNWEVCIGSASSISTKIVGKEEEFNTDIFWVLNPDSDKRIELFKEEAQKYRLPVADSEKWISILRDELSDEDASEIIADLRLTPTYLEQVLGHEGQTRVNRIETLVPRSLKYYERLIGVYSDSKNIVEYCENELVEHFQDTDTNYLNFIACANSSISRAIAREKLDDDLFKSLIEDAIKWQNPFMLIGCMEVGLADNAGAFEQEISAAFDLLISPETYEQIKLISALFVFVDGELSRLSIFKEKPSFYRRFAAFGQASLIAKVTVEYGFQFNDVQKWAMEQRGLVFYCQTFIDLRCEPRWLPGYISAQQLQDELHGRLIGAFNSCDNQIFSNKLRQILEKEKPLPLNAFFSGPLEGNIEPNVIPDDVRKNLEEKLGGTASLEAFTALISLTQICKVDSKYAELATSLLESTQHQIEGDVNKDIIYQLLNGLATVAANLRSKKLAGSVMILSRVYRDFLDVNGSPENILGVGLVSAAAFDDKDEWAEFIGQWAFEIVCLNLNDRVRGTLLAMLTELCVLEPYLYFTCSRSIEILKTSF